MLSKGIENPAELATESQPMDRALRRHSGAQFRMMLDRADREHRATPTASDTPGGALPLSPTMPPSTPVPVAVSPAKAAFKHLLSTHPGTPIVPRPVQPNPPSVPLPPSVPAAPEPLEAVPTVSSRQRLGAQLASMLVNPDLPVLELLTGDLRAGDEQYNVREAMLRSRLNVVEVERRLKDLARKHEVSYDATDLDGIIRNAGYDATHLGSTERYMNAVEKFIGEAENNYRQRSSNKPGTANA